MAAKGIDQHWSPVLSTPPVDESLPRAPLSLSELERIPSPGRAGRRRFETGSAMPKYGHSGGFDWSKDWTLDRAGAKLENSWRKLHMQEATCPHQLAAFLPYRHRAAADHGDDAQTVKKEAVARRAIRAATERNDS
ncbi:hypothetical protein ColLi_12123 [Colletotrichum liriopes]|uniref:Uncharacterized protein n=1 Tax=Colletotrichum liriopes TaxID=708192 RepID=A0AA37GXT1_9PEZI|nr:hypothetical protein ColLi_12123 [Colletotrichum liriopes]